MFNYCKEKTRESIKNGQDIYETRPIEGEKFVILVGGEKLVITAKEVIGDWLIANYHFQIEIGKTEHDYMTKKIINEKSVRIEIKTSYITYCKDLEETRL